MSELPAVGDAAQGAIKGRFQKGSPGRLSRRIDVAAACRRFAKKEGIELDFMVWLVVKRLLAMAVNDGNIKAAALALKHLGAREQPPSVAVNVGAPDAQVSVDFAGPPIPPLDDLLASIDGVRKLAINKRRERKRITVTDAKLDAVVQQIMGLPPSPNG